MKIFIFLILFNFSHILNAEVYRFDLDIKSKTLELVKLNKAHVSKNCFDSSKKCMSAIKKSLEKLKLNNEISERKIYGHPASIFCQKLEGGNVIVFDKDNNQYDLCLINSLYYIDSWDLYNQFKK